MRILARQGKVGHTDSAALRMEIDHCLLVESKGGKWIIKYFAAGD